MKLKEFKTIKEQIDLLKNKHNLTIEDETNATMILRSMNYYSIRGYGIFFENKEIDQLSSYRYITGTKIEDIYNIYKFDSNFKALLLTYIGYIEKRIRTEISHAFISLHGMEPDSYLNYDNYFPEEKMYAEKMINKIYDSLIIKDRFGNKIPRDKNNEIVRNHINKYEGLFPLWVLIEYFSIGDIISFLRCMIKNDRNKISSLYNLDYCDLDNQLYVLKFIRNKCAHFNRIIGIKVPKINCYNSNSLFHALLIIKSLIYDKKIAEQFADEMIELFETLFNQYSSIDFINKLSFPTNWKDLLHK